MVSVRKRIRRSLRGTRPIVTALWCTTTVALVLLHLLTCTSFTSASHPREEKIETFLILNKYAPPITETPAVLQDSNDASSSTRKLKRDTEQEQASILALLEAYNGPPQAPEASSNVETGAVQPVFIRHRKWTRSRDIVHHLRHRSEQFLELDPAHPSYYQTNTLLDTTTTTTNLEQLITKIWKDMILMTLRVFDHKRSLNPAAAAATATYHQLTRRRRPGQLRRKLPESNNNYNKKSTNKFPHTSNNDFDSDYKDPENHPPRSN